MAAGQSLHCKYMRDRERGLGRLLNQSDCASGRSLDKIHPPAPLQHTHTVPSNVRHCLAMLFCVQTLVLLKKLQITTKKRQKGMHVYKIDAEGPWLASKAHKTQNKGARRRVNSGSRSLIRNVSYGVYCKLTEKGQLKASAPYVPVRIDISPSWNDFLSEIVRLPPYSVINTHSVPNYKSF